MGKSGSRSSRKYNFNTPATELMSEASAMSAKGSSPRSKASRMFMISTWDPETLKNNEILDPAIFSFSFLAENPAD